MEVVHGVADVPRRSLFWPVNKSVGTIHGGCTYLAYLCCSKQPLTHPVSMVPGSMRTSLSLRIPLVAPHTDSGTSVCIECISTLDRTGGTRTSMHNLKAGMCSVG